MTFGLVRLGSLLPMVDDDAADVVGLILRATETQLVLVDRKNWHILPSLIRLLQDSPPVLHYNLFRLLQLLLAIYLRSLAAFRL